MFSECVSAGNDVLTDSRCRKRACQYILKKAIPDGYERFRPSNVTTRRRRMFLIGTCINLRRAYVTKIKDQASAWSSEESNALEANAGALYHEARTLEEDPFHDHFIHADSNIDNFFTSSLNGGSPVDEMNQTHIPLTTVSPEGSGVQGPDFPSFDSFADMEFCSTILNDEYRCPQTVEASSATGCATQAQPVGLLPSSLDPMLLSNATPLEQADDDLWTAKVFQEPMFAIAGTCHRIETGTPRNEAKLSVTGLADTSSDSHEFESNYSQLIQDTDSLEAHTPVMAFSPVESVPRRNSMTSKIRKTLDRSSERSLRERQSVLDVLQRFSTSPISSLSMSVRSRASQLSSKPLKSSDIAVDQETTSVQGEINDSTYVANRVASGPQPMKAQGPYVKLPGDFISSSINTFSKHLCCLYKRSEMGFDFCQYCFMGASPDSEFLLSSIPYLVLRLKRGHPIDVGKSFSHWDWVDRFGNTALHILATTGPKVSRLLHYIHIGPETNAVNTAGQTFLHVLNTFDIITVTDHRALRDHLVQLQFNFRQRDVHGRTFLESWAKGRTFSSAVAHCWLEPLLRMDKNSKTLNYAWALETFCNLGGSLNDWRLGFSESMSCVPLFFQLNENDLGSLYQLLASEKDYPGVLESYQDSRGRNSLHLSVDNAMKLRRDPSGETQSIFAPLFRLRLMKRLFMETNIDVNHHDGAGYTPLMVSIHSPPNEYQLEIITTLLGHGAYVDSRNHEGESALHLSVKLGHTGATHAVLSHGANVHVRNTKGLGVLAVGEIAMRRARKDVVLYARIMACMNQVADAGAVVEPTLFQEWDLQRP